jgi:lysophospholipid acyltransferase (LPLAT)-like uncharacterized protein
MAVARAESGESTAPSPDRRTVWMVRVGGWLVRMLGMTWRVRVSHDADVRRLREAGQPIVFALWHGQILPLLHHHRDEQVAVLISEHHDGEIMARMAIHLGYRTVRGSTSRGAARALLELARVLRQGRDIAITPDGPRGPAKSVAPGAFAVAQRTGAPVIGAAAWASSTWRLKSWDSFMIPRPFARVSIAYSDAHYITSSAAVAGAGGGEGKGGDSAGQIERMRDAMATAESRAEAQLRDPKGRAANG